MRVTKSIVMPQSADGTFKKRYLHSAPILILNPRELDFGTGTGLIALEFLHSIKKIVAADSSKDMLNFLQRKLNADSITTIEPLEWSIGIDPSPFPGFDIIIASLTLHHVPDTNQAAEIFLFQPETRWYHRNCRSVS